MESMQKAVVDWRLKFGLPVGDTAHDLTFQDATAHIQLIREEFEEELVPALLAGDLVEIYDAGLDVIVCVIGLLSDAGFDLEPGLAEVMRGNYSKLDPETNEPIRSRGLEVDGAPLGKVMKGSAYVASNLKAIVESCRADLLADDPRAGRDFDYPGYDDHQDH